MTFTFNNAIPSANNDPSADQPDMLINNQSNLSIWAVDHRTFNVANGGTHLQVSMADQAAPAIPGGLTSVLFSNLQGGQSVPFWKNALATYNIAIYTGAISPIATGYTRLPGGIIMQWGQIVSTSTAITPLVFPTPFASAVFSITFGLTASGSTGHGGTVYVSGATSTTGFSWQQADLSSSHTGFYWTAIGL